MGRKNWARAAIASVCLVVAAACGGSSPKATTTTSTTPITSPSPTTTSEKSRAEAIVLVDSDFPSGWQGSAHSEDPSDKELDRRFKACTGVSFEPSTDVFGHDFDMNQSSVGSEVQFFKAAAQVQTDIGTIYKPGVIACVRGILVDALKKILEQQGAAGAQVSSISLTRIAVPKYADGSAAIRFSAVVTVGGQSLRFFQDIIVARKGRIEMTASFFNLGAVFPPALQRTLFASMAARAVADGGA